MLARRIFETVLYAEDLGEAEAFYRDVLGLTLADRGESYLAFRCETGVLLIFDAGRSAAPGRMVPSHGARGAGHLAFVIPPREIDDWLAHLARHHVAVESIVDWPEGGRSIYFRDPAGNSLELAPPTLWGGNWN